MGTESLHCAYFSSDGKFLLCYAGNRLLLDTATGREVRPLRADAYALAPVGGLMAERADNRVRIFDVETGRAVVTLEESAGDLSDLTFSPDGRVAGRMHDYNQSPVRGQGAQYRPHLGHGHQQEALSD